MFAKEVVRSLNELQGASRTFESFFPHRRLLNESFHFNQPTLFAFSPNFLHSVARRAPNAFACGFIAPAPIPVTPEFSSILAMLDRTRGRKPRIYCGFGSMQSKRTNRITAAVTSAATRAGVELVLQGSELPAGFRSQHVLCPPGDHRELFSRCDALIHQGGAGTFRASLESGKPFCIVPQWADQFHWWWQARRLRLSVEHQGSPFSVRGWLATFDRLLGASSTETCANRADLVYDGYHDALAFITRNI
jgi:UDP:flavonoid glycosyltransferase YjiC (YdhE family)